jgi:hypothetical protein
MYIEPEVALKEMEKWEKRAKETADYDQVYIYVNKYTCSNICVIFFN